MGARVAGQSLDTSNLADLLERVLDKGVVIAGDIRVKLVDIELLTIQIRLVICSVDKAKEMGMDWWANQPILTPKAEPSAQIIEMQQRLERMEAQLADATAALAAPPTQVVGVTPTLPIPLAAWRPPLGPPGQVTP